MPRISRRSERTRATSASSWSPAARSSPCRPAEARITTWPAGAEPGHFVEVKVAAVTRCRALRGTRTPLPGSTEALPRSSPRAPAAPARAASCSDSAGGTADSGQARPTVATLA